MGDGVTPPAHDAAMSLQPDRWSALLRRAYTWYEDRHPEELTAQPEQVEVALAVAKPTEERGEAIGAYIKWRRAFVRRDYVLADQLWAELEAELADMIIAPWMSARALGFTLTDLFDVVEQRIAALEQRPKGGRHA